MASTGGFTIMCIVITYHVLQSVLLSERAAFHLEEAGGQLAHIDKKTLAFSVCNGMANQRLSLLYGVMLASELGRAVVLPEFALAGREDLSAANIDTVFNSTFVPMSDLYDVKHFISALAAVGIEVLDTLAAPPRSLATEVDISKMEDIVEALSAKQYKDVNHLAIGCPLFRVPVYYFTGANSRILWATLEGITPSKQIARNVNSVIKQLKHLTHHRSFNFLHLRIETDWQQHCERWQKIPDGRVRNNCMNNTYTVDEVGGTREGGGGPADADASHLCFVQ
jgi:hypothetical protein